MDKISNLKSLILKTLDTNKALDIVSIDLKNKSSIADYMIIASGTSSRHIQALSEQVVDKIKLSGIKNCKIEGSDSSDWKLIDGIDIIIHIFNPEKIIIGGGVSQLFDNLLAPINQRIAKSSMKPFQDTLIQKSTLDDNAGLLGATCEFFQQY